MCVCVCVQPSTAVLQYYESVMLYTQVLNETLAAGEDVRDGLAMTQKMWNRTFEGLCSPDMTCCPPPSLRVCVCV